jgi:hypothetical protein
MTSRSLSGRHFAPRVFALAVTVVLLVRSAALAAPPTYFDVATNSDQPSSTAERGQTYFLYNLNPLRNETVTIDDKLTTPANANGTAGKPTGSGATPLKAGSKCSLSNTAACVSDLAALVSEVHRFSDTFNQPEAATVDKRAAAVVTAALETFKADSQFGPAVTVSDEVSTYVTFLNAHVLTPGVTADVRSAVDPYRSAKVANERNDANDIITAVRVATASVKDPDKAAVTLALDAAATALKDLDSSTITSIAAKADAAANTWTGIVSAKQTDVFYKVVKAPCTPSGFRVHTYTVKLLRGSDAQWTQTITCLPEFQVGAMYYADFLDTHTYSVVVPPGGGTAVITRQSSDINHGSLAAAVHWCPGDQGGNAFCATFAGSSTNNGLDIFLGGGMLFGHRTFGLHGGAHVGQITVLQDGYSRGQAVPSGTTFTRKQTSVGPFIGLTINTK